MTDNSIVIEAKQLRKSFAEKEVVRGIDFTVYKGKCFGFLGPNGAGKTTTLKMIEGVSPPGAGQLLVFGHELPAMGRMVRARMGIVPQMDNLDPDFTIIENLRMYGVYFRLPAKIIEQRIHELLEFMALSDRAHDRPDNLSGGMKRRLTIARALINDPELIVLDEPTTGLDPQVRHVIWAKLRELMQHGKTLLLTTHYMDEAERLCDELFIMDHGVILDTGSPAALIQKHVEKDVVEVRGEVNAVRERLTIDNSVRLESHGDTLFCYTQTPTPLVNALMQMNNIKFSARPADLEDVFLRLTGRELRE